MSSELLSTKYEIIDYTGIPLKSAVTRNHALKMPHEFYDLSNIVELEQMVSDSAQSIIHTLLNFMCSQIYNRQNSEIRLLWCKLILDNHTKRHVQYRLVRVRIIICMYLDTREHLVTLFNTTKSRDLNNYIDIA